MLQQMYIPQPPLSDFVALFWLQEGYAPAHRREIALPEGTVEIIINLHQDHLPVFDRTNPNRCKFDSGMLVYGSHSEYFVIDTNVQTAILGIHFKPGGAFPFLKLPADELHNQVVSLDTLWGFEAHLLRERLLASPTPAAKFRLLEEALLAKCCQPQHRAVAFALKEFHRLSSVSAVTDSIGLSPRRLNQIFREEVGLSPKLFLRVRRFQKVIRLLHSASQPDWTQIALDCGYYDQAHFIHDFRAFSGLNPTSYLVKSGERLNHPVYD